MVKLQDCVSAIKIYSSTYVFMPRQCNLSVTYQLWIVKDFVNKFGVNLNSRKACIAACNGDSYAQRNITSIVIKYTPIGCEHIYMEHQQTYAALIGLLLLINSNSLKHLRKKLLMII